MASFEVKLTAGNTCKQQSYEMFLWTDHSRQRQESKGVPNRLTGRTDGQSAWLPYEVHVKGEANTDGVKSNGSSSKRENDFLILTMSISPWNTFISYLPMESLCVIAQSFHCRKKHTKAPQ